MIAELERQEEELKTQIDSSRYDRSKMLDDDPRLNTIPSRRLNKTTDLKRRRSSRKDFDDDLNDRNLLDITDLNNEETPAKIAK